MENIPCFSGWEIVSEIGRGHFGAVYEIQKTSDGSFDTAVEHSAMKVISIPPSDGELKSIQAEYDDEATVTTLLRSQVDGIVKEFELMAQLQGHSNIVGYHDHEIVQQRNGVGWNVLIRMELLTSLSAYAKGKAVDEATAVRLGLDMCRALKRCEECNILHRDIKPQNIFVNKYGDFKLGDFGVARVAERMTASTVAGTYTYMAPEVYSHPFNNESYDKRIDIYSLGLVLYWLLNERRGPFLPLPPEPLDSDSQNTALARRMSGEPLPPPIHGGKTLQNIVLKACAFLPEERYQSAAEFYDALNRLSAEIGYETILLPKEAEIVPDASETPAKEDSGNTVLASGESPAAESDGYEAAPVPFPEDIETPAIPLAHSQKPKVPVEQDPERTISAFEETQDTEPAGSKTLPVSRKPGAKKKSKNRLPIYLLGVWILVLLAGILVLTLKRGKSSPADSAEVPSTAAEANAEEAEHVYDQEVASKQYLKRAASCTRPAVYYKSCECGEAGTETFTYGEANGHAWDIGTVTAAATHTSAGEIVYTCTVCGQTKEEAVDPLAEHTYDQETASEQYLKRTATCTMPAVYYKSCECGEAGTETFTYGEARGHTWDSGTVITEATHTSAGEIVYTCTVCGQTKEEAVDPLTAHTYDQEVAGDQYLLSAADCTSPAVYYKSCVCGEAGAETFTYGEVAGHSWNDGAVTIAATHTSAGTKTYSCTVCGQTREESIAQLTAHTYDRQTVSTQYLKSAATCTKAAVYYKSCECGERGTETFTYGTAAGHSWNSGVVTTAATHTSTGTRLYTCTACGSTKTETVARLTTHTFDQEVVSSAYLKSEATYTSPAVYYKSCKCGQEGTATFTYGNVKGYISSMGGSSEKVSLESCNTHALVFSDELTNCKKLTVNLDITMKYGASCTSWKLWGKVNGSYQKIADITLPGGDGSTSQTVEFDTPITLTAIAITPKVAGGYSWSQSLWVTDIYCRS